MLRLSKLTDYATVLLGYLARQRAEVHAAVEIAEATRIGLPTVSKLLKLLARSGLVHSIRGAKGGYRLSFAPDKISVADIVQAIEGPIALTECSISDDYCEQSANCDIRGNWRVINKAMRTALQSVTLADLAFANRSSTPVEFKVSVDSLTRG
ncbi:MAG: SUF system Fe-S cluster assembly regulator [Gammaproteobacteria bacterium]